MIRREDILFIDYLKKAAYTGSHQGMRYRLEGVAAEEAVLAQPGRSGSALAEADLAAEDADAAGKEAPENSGEEDAASAGELPIVDGKYLQVTLWPEPYNYTKTPEEQKTRAFFTFDEDGIVDAVAWMNDMLFQWKDL